MTVRRLAIVTVVFHTRHLELEPIDVVGVPVAGCGQRGANHLGIRIM